MKLVLIGGGEIPKWNFDTKDENQELYETEKIDKEIVRLSNKKNPKFLFIGTAKKDNIIYYNAIKDIYEKLGCQVELLNTISEDIKKQYLEEKVLNSDIIYIGGGNTRFMLDRWNKIGLDIIIKKAIEKNIVIAGFSAGAYAMCKYSYDLIPGLDILNIMLCVHYNKKTQEKKDLFIENVKLKKIEGIALDNSVAIAIDEDKKEYIKNFENRKIYKILYKNKEIKIEEF